MLGNLDLFYDMEAIRGPQDLDEEFLVLSDKGIGASGTYVYLSVEELQDFLCKKVEHGYAFPLNPKWILCDKGWKKVYTLMLESNDATVKNAMNCWYPPDSGIRERIEAIHKRHPNGFVTVSNEHIIHQGTYAMDIARLTLKRSIVLRRAKRKFQTIFIWIKFWVRLKRLRKEREAKALTSSAAVFHNKACSYFLTACRNRKRYAHHFSPPK